MLQRDNRVTAKGTRLPSLLRHDLPQRWWPAVAILTAAYAAITVLIIVGSPLNSIDSYWYHLSLVPPSSPLHLPVESAVFVGQRVPAMIVAGAYVAHRIRQTRSTEPLVLFALASVIFVASVGAGKYLIGRIGPRYTNQAHTVWAGGDIFPSGHVTGAVVMYGLIAVLAPRVHRELFTAVAIVVSCMVGFGTIALNTHWFSDVLGGWLDGALVLLVAWAITPAVHARLAHAVHHWRRQAHLRRRPVHQQRSLAHMLIEHARAAEVPVITCRRDAATPHRTAHGAATPDATATKYDRAQM